MEHSSINPGEYRKLGSWANGTYVNALTLMFENAEWFKKQLGLEYGNTSFIILADDIFYPEKDFQSLKSQVYADPEPFIIRWNANCEKAIIDLRAYVDSRRDTDFSRWSDAELLQEMERFEARMGDLSPFLWSYLPVSEAIESWILEAVPGLSFDDVRPARHISSELLNDAVTRAPDDTALEVLAREWAWYGINLLRAKPLSIEDVRGIKKTATPAPMLSTPENSKVQELQTFMWLKFERIDVLNYALYYMRPLVAEILARNGLKERYWDVLQPNELKAMLTGNPVPENLDLRFEYRATVKDGERIYHPTVEEWRALRKMFVENTVIEKTEVLKGQIACKGRVAGTVTVIHAPSEIVKVKPGDILVAAETLVQHEPYLKNVSAMIIETGGMLIHSAIFAREFSIPTIVGVKNATKILADGDKVEVDADTGEVRTLS